MACCTGQTKCNDTVTIGYLKSFIGNDILTTAGTPVSVSTSQPDSYCPTYAELTGGTLIPNFVDGGTNKWASNVDGITINHGSSYSGNQVVKVNDLILTYTRYKSIAVSASSTSLSECGGSTTLGRTFKLTKTIKAMNDCNGGAPSTSSSEGSDSAFTTTYSSTQGWLTINGNTATAPKNGTVSSSTLTTEVKASVNYKGVTHTSTGVTVSQSALTGAYETTGTTTPTGMDLIITPSDQKFGCRGGNYAITGTGNYYTRYKWKDSCGTVYNEVYNDVQGTDNVGPYGGVLDAVNCNDRPCDPCYTYDVNVQWSGITSAITFTQSCQERCEECNSYDEWGSGSGTATAPCEGGRVQVTAEVSGMHYERAYIGDVCRTVSTSATSMVQGINVNIPQNEGQTEKTYTGSGTTSQGGTINYTITQPGGCAGCHDPQVLYTFDDITVSCDSGAATSQTASYTKVTTYIDCQTETESGSTIVAIPARECWSDPNPHVIQQGSSAPALANAQPKIIQEGGCTCTSCTCNDLNVKPVDSLPSSSGNNVTIAKYSADCLTNLAVTESAVWLSNISIGNGIVTATVDANTGSTVRDTVITIIGDTDEETCTKNVTVYQDSVVCTCKDVVFTEKTTTVGSGGTPSSGEVLASASFGVCTGSLGVASVNSEASSWLTASTSGNDVVINVAANTELSNNRSGTTTVTYKANSSDVGYNCSSSFTVSQISTPCDCTSLDIFITSIKTEFGSGGTHGDMVLIASGDTLGCGRLSAKTTSDWFADEYGNSGASIVTRYIDDTKREKVEFYLNVLPYKNWESGGRHATSEIYFIPKGSDVPQCSGTSFTIQQYDDRQVLASCSELEVNRVAVGGLDCESGRIALYRIEPIYPDVTVYLSENYTTFDYVFSASSRNNDWLGVSDGMSLTIARTSANVNDVASARTGTIDYVLCKRRNGTVVEVCNDSLSSLTFTQEGCSIARDCSGCSTYYINDVLLRNALDDAPALGKTINLWDYIGGHSFCDPRTTSLLYVYADIPSEMASYITYDANTDNIIISQNDSTEPRNISFTVRLYSYETNPPVTCDTETVNGSQKGACRCDQYWTPSNKYSYSGMENIDYREHIVYMYFFDGGNMVTSEDIEACGGIGISAETSDSAITATSSGYSNATLHISENDTGQDRTITGYIGIGECRKPFSFVQTAKEPEPPEPPEPDCDCTIIASYDYPTLYRDESPSRICTYTFAHSGDCLSTVHNIYTANGLVSVQEIESHTYDDDIVLYGHNEMTQTGCATDTVYFEVLDSGGTTCYTDSFTVYLNNGCKALISYDSKGQVTSAGATAGPGAQDVLIGYVYGCPAGSFKYLCYYLAGQPQDSKYISGAVRFVPITQTGISSFVDYEIHVNYGSPQLGQQSESFNIDIYLKKESDDCSGASSENIGVVLATIDPNA